MSRFDGLLDVLCQSVYVGKIVEIKKKEEEEEEEKEEVVVAKESLEKEGKDKQEIGRFFSLYFSPDIVK